MHISGIHGLICACFLYLTFHRYPHAREQRLLVDLFERAGKMYYDSDRSQEFVAHILHLNVPQLFAIERSGQQINEEDNKIVTKFCNVLVKYGTMDTQYFLKKQLDYILVWITYLFIYKCIPVSVGECSAFLASGSDPTVSEMKPSLNFACE